MKKRKSLSSAEKKRIKHFRDKSEHVCYYCEKEIPYKEFVTVDHKKSLSQGGEHREENFAIACSFCNSEKGTMAERQYQHYRRYKKYLHTLEENQLQEKEKIFISLLRDQKTTVFLRLTLGRKMKALKKMKDGKTKKMHERLQKTIKKMKTSPIKMDQKRFQEIEKQVENKHIDHHTMSVLFEEMYQFLCHVLETHDVSGNRKTKIIEIKNNCVYSLSLLNMKEMKQ